MAQWHWEKPGFDDLAIQKKVEQAVEKGHRQWPQWSYAVPKPYNGASGPQRIAGWQRVWLACHMGLIPFPKLCSICGSPRNVQYHNEDYFRPLQAKPVCAGCHRVLHMRFRNPDAWLALVARYGQTGKWFSNLTMERTEVAKMTTGHHYDIEVDEVKPKGPIQPRAQQRRRVSVRHRTRNKDQGELDL